MKSSISHLIRGLTSQTNRSLILVVAMLLALGNVSYGQEYAVSQTNSHVDDSFLLLDAVGSVTNGANAVGAPDANFATLYTEGLKATSLVTIASKAIINLTLPANVAAGKHSYVRVDAPTQTGINLDLGSLVNVLGLLENHTILVTTNAGTAQSHFVKDASGNLYLQVTSTLAYNRITVTLDFGGSTTSLGSVLALGTLSLKVYHVVTYENGGFTPCDASQYAFTGIDPEAVGIELTLSESLQDPEKAIDGIVSLGNYSLLQNGNVGAVSTVKQTIYLGKTAPGTNEVVAIISRPALLLDLSVLSGISIQAYNGATAAGAAVSISSVLIGLKLLDFQNNNLAYLVFTPGAPFDRIVFTSTGVADVFTGLRIHELGSRPPVAFTGGRVVGSIAGEAVNSSILVATANSSPTLAGFSIGCSTPEQHTYSLYEVDQSARTLGGSLPPSFVLSPEGQLTGSPELDENDTYNFDVLATNQFGQSAFTAFIVTIETNLPVTLVKFDAAAEGSTTALSWSTSAETNSDRFDIERSQTGKNWSKIGTVMSNHESTSLQYYSFSDSKPLDGQNFYRLKMVDLDGTFAYSQIKNVKFAISDYLYPNPVSSNENLSINLTDWSKIKLVKVINATGKTVFESSNALSSGINTKNLSAGTYILKMIHSNGSVSTHKFVRQ
ncbi:T9SS type A sorting domain-containing protein [Dyadobacter pollutisoli]|jgi:hypothetical protein|uniref:T9SS type A sorting domain-containing protein n=1 Tax=Dyadobacter pollutisoli TaxID=2910158 RepID=A0A9E8NEI0_9BACT|nr:T9SS type A sorting domain-containing protein [Dyadobacter pollutisoli]WAC12837.1 T9SS type A sorting domain-containing protein [Dyadobacter pollutisoli]